MVATVGSISIDLSTNVAKFSSGFRTAATTVDRESGRMAKSVKGVESSFASLARSAATIAVGGLGTRQIASYADAWTEAGNKIRAAGEVAERQGRSLEGLNDIATATRSGIRETVDLYAKLLRSTKDVANSEQEVALATEIVNKAFKAGGAAASEQAAGILQLSQALGSGVLQGDELRSIRENAPILANAIANEFNTTIAGLKELGKEGAITSERVFKAILNSQGSINKAFEETNITLGESITLLGNTLVETIGKLDQSTGFTKAFTDELARLNSAIDALADNPNLGNFLNLFQVKIEEGGLVDNIRWYISTFDEAAIKTGEDAEKMRADIAAIEAQIVELITNSDATEWDLLNAEKLADDVSAMKQELASLEAASISSANEIRAAFAQAFRASENASMAALKEFNQANLPTINGNSAKAGGTGTRTRDRETGIGVTRFGTEEITESVDGVSDRIDRLDSGLGRHFEELGGSFDNTFDSVNDLLERGYQIIYDSIADGVRTGIVSGIQEGRGERKQYKVSTGPKDAGASQFGQFKNYSYAGAFAEGGSFIAPGNQSGDTTRLMMDVNGGEKVTVSPPGSGAPITLIYNAAPGENERTSRQNARIMLETLNRETARA
jgi:tape measure domain-containing protein